MKANSINPVQSGLKKQFFSALLSSAFFTKIILPLVMIFLSAATFAQPPAVQWDARFGGNDEEIDNKILQTSDGGFIVAGASRSVVSGDKTQPSRGGYDMWVIKMNASGIKQWDAVYGGNGTDNAASMIPTGDGHFVLGGYSNSGISGEKTEAARGGGGHDYWLVKIDNLGNKVWDRTFGGSEDDASSRSCLQSTSDGGYLIAGSSNSGISGEKSQPSRGGYDYWIVKTDADGFLEWDATFGSSADDDLMSVNRTTDGGFLLGGATAGGISGDKTLPSKGGNDFWVVKIDNLGNKQWDAVYGGSGQDEMRDMVVTADGGFAMIGRSNSGVSGDKTEPSRGGYDYWLVKADASGNVEWDATFGGNSTEEVYNLRQTADNGFILAGISTSGISGDKTQNNWGGFDGWLVKTDAAGNKRWDGRYGGTGNDFPHAIEIASDGSYVFSGYTLSGISGDITHPSRGSFDIFVMRLASDLNFLSICEGDSVYIGGSYRTTAGVYDDTLAAADGSDSVVTTILSLLPNAFTTQNIGICEGDSFFAGGSFQKTTGNYYDTLVAANGCDSVITTVLTVFPNPEVSIAETQLPEWCQGQIAYLTAVASWSSTYEWTGGLNGETIQTQLGTIYSVTATDTNGCTGEASFTTTVLSDLLSAYTIISWGDVSINRNTVYSGGVGSKNPDGKVELRNSTIVTAPGTFVRAANIVTLPFSQVTEKIYQPVTAGVPAFERNPYCKDGQKVDVRDNTTITLNESTYKEIKVGKNSMVIFTQKEVYINSIETKDNAVIRFAQCSRVRICKDISLAKGSMINPEGHELILFVEKNVYGGNGIQINADIYARKDIDISKGSSSRPNIMRGLFIASKVSAQDYTYWYQHTVCDDACQAPNAPLVFKIDETEATAFADVAEADTEVNLKAYPNPFSDKLNIEFTLAEDSRVKLEIFNLAGQRIDELFEGDVKSGELQKFEFIPQGGANGMIIYRLQTESGSYYGKAVMAR